MNKGVNRRDFFKLAAVSGAAVAVAGCEADPVEEIIPMLVPPHDYVPGVSIHFATTCNECSAQCGMVVRTREGRAIKAEGNRKNPMNNGGLCAIGQGSMQGLYAPTRLKGPKTKSGAVTWADGKKLLTEKLTAAAGSVVYIGNPASGSIEGLKAEFLKATGGGQAFQFDANPTVSVKEGNRLAFGKNEIPHYAIENAKVLVSFGADFLESWLNPVTFTKGYSKMHAFQGGEKGKFIHVSSHMSLTGTNADQWIDTAPGTEAQIALAVANELLGSASVSSADKSRLNDYLSGYDAASVSARTGVPEEKIKALSLEFNQGGASLAIAGGTAASGKDATALQVAVNILNHVAGNIGKTVQFGANYQTGGDSLNDILAALKAG
ncbi:MAG: twin-arginine translocation signal domain-containing protein, partial [SAR324 cluster bacterium]|nr:twin-arginine translocation signal domain-containing protein [SAR324 cluster bacterium]